MWLKYSYVIVAIALTRVLERVTPSVEHEIDIRSRKSTLLPCSQNIFFFFPSRDVINNNKKYCCCLCTFLRFFCSAGAGKNTLTTLHLRFLFLRSYVQYVWLTLLHSTYSAFPALSSGFVRFPCDQVHTQRRPEREVWQGIFQPRRWSCALTAFTERNFHYFVCTQI